MFATGAIISEKNPLHTGYPPLFNKSKVRDDFWYVFR